MNTLFIYEPEKSAVVFRRTKKIVRQYLKEICMKKLLRRGKQREKLEFENEESLETIWIVSWPFIKKDGSLSVVEFGGGFFTRSVISMS